MSWNSHPGVAGQHAPLSASKHTWLRYTDDHMKDVFFNNLNKQRGTELHAFAEQANRLGIHMPRNSMTINNFINDGIKYDMKAEVVLWYSQLCFGTADLIGYDGKKRLLRIFDLKTGNIEVKSFDQIHIYAALFCLEYHVDPRKLSFDFRFYQNDEVRIEDDCDPEIIVDVMELIRHFNSMYYDMYDEAKRLRAI